MATTTTMALLNANFLSTANSPKIFNPLRNPSKPAISLLSMQKGLTPSSKKVEQDSIFSSPLAGTALAGAFFSALSSSDTAFAAQQIAEIAEGDNRGLALLLPIIPTIAWVLFNILQPALNQINQMRSAKGIIIGLGLGGFAASGFVHPPQASAASSELAAIAEAASNDNRGQLLLFVITPAILWVLYNILQPALNQINRMRS